MRASSPYSSTDPLVARLRGDRLVLVDEHRCRYGDRGGAGLGRGVADRPAAGPQLARRARRGRSHGSVMVSICCRNSSALDLGLLVVAGAHAPARRRRSGDRSRGRRASAPPRRRACEWPRQPVPRCEAFNPSPVVAGPARALWQTPAMLPRALVALACFAAARRLRRRRTARRADPAGGRCRRPRRSRRRSTAGSNRPRRCWRWCRRRATTLTVTDFDTIRVQLGVPDLTSADSDDRPLGVLGAAGQETALLTDGMLRADNSELMLDYGFTQDDVDWEAHFTGPDGNGYVIRFRPDLPLAGVTGRSRPGVGPLAGARVIPEDHLVVSGTAGKGEQVWANEPALGRAGRRAGRLDVRAPGLHPGQRRPRAAADAEHLAAVDAAHPCTSSTTCRRSRSRSATTWRRSGWGRTATDLFTRLDIGRDWPVRDFPQTFRTPVGDPATGRIGYDLPRPPAAAGADPARGAAVRGVQRDAAARGADRALAALVRVQRLHGRRRRDRGRVGVGAEQPVGRAGAW